MYIFSNENFRNLYKNQVYICLRFFCSYVVLYEDLGGYCPFHGKFYTFTIILAHLIPSDFLVKNALSDNYFLLADMAWIQKRHAQLEIEHNLGKN